MLLFRCLHLWGHKEQYCHACPAHCPPVIFIWRHSGRPVNSYLISDIHTSCLVEKCLNFRLHNRFGDISSCCTESNPRTKLQEMSYHGAVDGPWRLESIGWCEAKDQSLSHLVCFPLIRKKRFIALFRQKLIMLSESMDIL